MEEQNQTTNLETNIWYKILKVLMYAMLLMPLWVWSIFLFPFITTKVLYLRLVIEVAVVIYILLALRYPQLRPQWNWITIAVWVYMGVIFIASVFGVNFDKSFMGTIERGEGIVTILHFAAYFTMLPAVFRRERDWYRYLMSAVGMIGAIGILGFIQLTGTTLIVPSQGARITGTIGNAAFFAGFMLFGTFLSAYLLYHPRTREEKSGYKRVYLWVVLLITLAAIYLSQTRGALIALVGTVLLFALFLVIRSKRTKVKVASGLAILLLVLAGFGVYLGRDSEFIQNQNTLKRLATISMDDITTQSRFDTWNASLQAWQDRPVTGYGYENYNIGFNKYFPARIFKDQGSQLWFDRAHNIVFDQLVPAGMVGLLSYLAMFAAAFWILYRLFQKARERYTINWQMPAILGLGLIAYFGQNLFVFDTQATYLLLFLVLAYISHLQIRHLSHSETEETTEGGKQYQPGFVTAAALTVFMFVLAYFVNIEPALANYQTVQGILAARTGQFRQVEPAFRKALSYGTYMDEEIRQRLVDFANEAIDSGQLSPQEQAELYAFTVSELKKSIDESSEDVKNYLFLATVYNRAFNFNPAYADELLTMEERMIELSATRPQLYFEVGQAYFNQGQSERGLAHFQKAIDLQPEARESHFNFAVASILAGREDLAEQKLQQMLQELNFSLTARDYHTLGRAYAQNQNHGKAVEMFEKAIELSPENTNYYVRLAQEYGRVCDLTSARSVLERLLPANPNLGPQINQFIAELETNCQ